MFTSHSSSIKWTVFSWNRTLNYIANKINAKHRIRSLQLSENDKLNNSRSCRPLWLSAMTSASQTPQRPAELNTSERQISSNIWVAERKSVNCLIRNSGPRTTIFADFHILSYWQNTVHVQLVLLSFLRDQGNASRRHLAFPHFSKRKALPQRLPVSSHTPLLPMQSSCSPQCRTICSKMARLRETWLNAHSCSAVERPQCHRHHSHFLSRKCK